MKSFFKFLKDTLPLLWGLAGLFHMLSGDYLLGATFFVVSMLSDTNIQLEKLNESFKPKV